MNKQKHRVVPILLSLSAGVILIALGTVTVSAQTSLEQSMVTAAYMVDKAYDCNESEQIVDRFRDRIHALTESYGAYGDTLFLTYFLGTLHCLDMPLGYCTSDFQPSPYRNVPCDRFGQMFRSLRINQSDWQVSEGFR